MPQRKVVYEEEGGKAYTIRGEIIEETDTYVKIIQAGTGKIFTIPYSRIIKIEENNFTGVAP